MIRVVHVRKEPFTLYIGRAFGGEFEQSKWANPFQVWNRGRFNCLHEFETYARRELWHMLHELDNQTLGCWCKPKACHGEVLKRLREEQIDHALRGATLPE
jgi:hypothetical protein